ncbi:hypothetical protein DB347_23165 [Opitutaceae bacterium EW11]|nr:hypothetical protein DB347_23165 [Opitutaceae bacterium EW11]
MKRVSLSFRGVALALGLLASTAFADNIYVSVNYGGTPKAEGYIYGVPAGANYEWDVVASGPGGSANVMIGGAIGVNQWASGGAHYYDVNSTSYAADTYYYLAAYGSYPGYDSASAMLWIGW